MIEGTEHDLDLDYEDSDEDDERDFERRVARRQPGGDVDTLLRDLRDMIDQARPAPLSTAVKVDRDHMLELLDQSIERLPEDLRQSRWLLKERDEFLARTHREADEILAAARGQAERMVQRSEVLKSAEGKARRVVERARQDAARLRNECDDYCDQRLAQLEAVLERMMGVVGKGREKLRPSVEADAGFPNGDDGSVPEGEDDEAASVFFDQDYFVDPDPTT